MVKDIIQFIANCPFSTSPHAPQRTSYTEQGGLVHPMNTPKASLHHKHNQGPNIECLGGYNVHIWLHLAASSTSWQPSREHMGVLLTHTDSINLIAADINVCCNTFLRLSNWLLVIIQ